MKKKIWFRIAVILFITATCLWLAYPPSEKIRLGKDLQGGVSIVMQVRLGDRDDWQTIMSQVISVIKQRINPTGVLDISVQAQGRDRIEIVMPLPSEDVLAARKRYEDMLAQIVSEARIPSAELSQALRDGNAAERFGGDAVEAGGARIAQLTRLQLAHNKQRDTRAALDAVEGQEIDPAELARLQQSVADAEYEFEREFENTLRLSLDERRLVQAVIRPKEPAPQIGLDGKPVLDPVTNEPVMGPSPRETEINSLKAEFPNVASEIAAAVEAYDHYTSIRKGLDDPEDLLRLLRGAGVLDFHIAVRPGAAGINAQQLRAQLQERGPAGVDFSIASWFAVNDLKQFFKEPEQLEALRANPEAAFASRGLVGAEYDGEYYVLLYTTDAKSMTHGPGDEWSVTSTFRTTDRLGRPAVAFRLDDAGGAKMSAMTGRHVDEPMAIVLDGEVYSAPNLNSQIGKEGIIEGSFSEQELTYLIRVLAAGSLEARLSPEPIAINTLGPSLGKDNLLRGLEACLLSLIVTAMIMLGYYFVAGLVANIALLILAVAIFGIMSFVDATFTLPGLAGIALSIAMAVDANVLIYERIREEIVNNREDLRSAIRLGFSRAMSAIIDGNLTNLIVCVVLLYTATTEVKGFAYTMIIGVVATLFAALFVTRTILWLYTDILKARSLPMLPTVVPAIHRALEPNINWIGLRKFFLPLSAVLVIASLALVWSRGSLIFDTEFRGGVSMAMRTAVVDANHDGVPDSALPNGQPARVLLSLNDVRDRVRAIGAEAEATLANMPAAEQDTNSPQALRAKTLREMTRASVLTMGESQLRDDVVYSSDFQIKVANPSGIQDEATITNTVVQAIVDEFGTQLDVTPTIEFAGAGDVLHTTYTFPITDPELGKNIDDPRYTERVNEFLGGAAVVLRDMEPAITLSDLEHRLERMRGQPDFRTALGRRVQVIGLEPADGAGGAPTYRSAAVLVFDEAVNYLTGEPDRWDEQVAAVEWKLVNAALQQPPALLSVSSFSSAVAETLAANAVVAIVFSLLGMLTYIWLRFGSLRYSLASVVALGHNVIICLGALALTHYVSGGRFASMILLDEFRIDLNVIAALLTIIGYSLNDTIVILDRIRENRGKMLIVTGGIVNQSINQTFSRTVLTGGSTILASIILYVLGGTGIQPFAFTFLIGLIAGTYSSVAIAAPLVYKSGGERPIAETHQEMPMGFVEGEVG